MSAPSARGVVGGAHEEQDEAASLPLHRLLLRPVLEAGLAQGKRLPEYISRLGGDAAADDEMLVE